MRDSSRLCNISKNIFYISHYLIYLIIIIFFFSYIYPYFLMGYVERYIHDSHETRRDNPFLQVSARFCRVVLHNPIVSWWDNSRDSLMCRITKVISLGKLLKEINMICFIVMYCFDLLNLESSERSNGGSGLSKPKVSNASIEVDWEAILHSFIYLRQSEDVARKG